MSVIHRWIDTSFAVHADYKSHTGACLPFGRGCPVNISSKQKIYTCSSTKAELVTINDAMALVLWCQLFIMGQGFDVHDNIVYQDNQSTLLLSNNRRHSSGKKTRHIEIRYYFITDHVKHNNICLEYCPMEAMISDFLQNLYKAANSETFMTLSLTLTMEIRRLGHRSVLEQLVRPQRPELNQMVPQYVLLLRTAGHV